MAATALNRPYYGTNEIPPDGVVLEPKAPPDVALAGWSGSGPGQKPFDIFKLPKRWAATEAYVRGQGLDPSDTEVQVSFQKAHVVNGKPTIVKFSMGIEEAMTYNVPPQALPDTATNPNLVAAALKPAWPVPMRDLLPNEQLRNDIAAAAFTSSPEHILIVNNDIYGKGANAAPAGGNVTVNGGFAESDRVMLKAIYDVVRGM